MSVGIDEKGAPANVLFKANHAAHLVSSLRLSRIERVVASGLNGSPFTMPIAANIPSQSGSARFLSLAINQKLELVEGRVVAGRQHVYGYAGSIGELHRLCASPPSG